MTTVYMEVDRKIYTSDKVPFAEIGQDWLAGKMFFIYPQGKMTHSSGVIHVEIKPYINDGLIQGHTGAGWGKQYFDNSDETACYVRSKHLDLLERLTGAMT